MDFDNFEWTDEELAEIEKWDNRELGAEEEFVRVVPKSESQQIDEAIGLKTIRLRLRKELLEEIQEMAAYKGIHVQTWIRIALMKQIHESNLA
jgi:predicted DNA binding CopG/RHH family protein